MEAQTGANPTICAPIIMSIHREWVSILSDVVTMSKLVLGIEHDNHLPPAKPHPMQHHLGVGSSVEVCVFHLHFTAHRSVFVFPSPSPTEPPTLESRRLLAGAPHPPPPAASPAGVTGRGAAGPLVQLVL
jgi:hypothetical protein